MASITTRKRSDGSKAYRADVRVKRNGKVVYQESRTFDRKTLARDWSARRELELQEPGALLRIQHRGVTVEDLIDRYLDEFGHSFGRSKRHHLEYLRTFDLAERDAIELTAQEIVAHVIERARPDAGGRRVQPQTINNDLIWLGLQNRALGLGRPRSAGIVKRRRRNMPPRAPGWQITKKGPSPLFGGA